jgi:hypothetical protein
LRAYLFVAALLLAIFGGISAYYYSKFMGMDGGGFQPLPTAVAVAPAETGRFRCESKDRGAAVDAQRQRRASQP